MQASHASSQTPPQELGSSQERFFQTPRASEELRRRSVRGAGATALGQGAKFLLRVGSTAVLARLLTPADYGLVAMTTVLTGFVGLFKDAGLTSATVQSEKITHQQISNVFWTNVSLGCAIALFLVGVAPMIAAFYHEPRLVGVTRAIALTFVLGGLTVQHQALLKRQMHFKTLALLEIMSMTSGIVVGVTMAWLGYGYWSLVGAQIGTAVSHMAGSWLAIPWRPALPRRDPGTKRLLKFGSDVLSFNVVNYFARQADSMLIGWQWGSVALGLYDKAYNLLLLPIGQINAPLAAVAVPALSRTRSNPAQLAVWYLGALQLVASLSVPLVVAIAVFADEIVALLLGPQWADCASLFRLLAVAAMLGATMNPVGWLLIPLGQTRKYKRIGLVNSCVIVTAFFIGLPYGAKGVALSYSLAMAALVIPTWQATVKDTPVRLRDLFGALAPAFVACLPAALAALGLRLLWPSHSAGSPAVSVLGFVVFGAAYAAVLLVGFRKWALFKSLLRDFRRPS